MSQENVDLAYRAYDAINQRDLGAVLALMDDDVEAVPLVAAIEGSYHGHEGMRRWWKNLLDAFPDFTVQVAEVRDLGDLTVAILRLRGQGAGSELPTENMVWHASRSRRGKCTWWRNFNSRDEALEAVGLKE